MPFNTSKRYGFIALAVAVLLLIVATIAIGLLDRRAQTTPQQAVDRFYTSWIASLNEGGKSPLERGLHRKSTYLTEGFVHDIERMHEEGKDAVLCSGTIPQRFSTGDVRIAENDQSASIRFSTDTAEGYVILIRDEQGWWRIDEVDCSSS